MKLFIPVILGTAREGRHSEKVALHLKDLSFRRFGDNFMVSGYVKR